MKSRCTNPNHNSYHRYGGRGIYICSEWLHSYDAFEEWANNNGYTENLTLDRINPDGNYEPSNCRWTTARGQANNRITNRYLTYNGQTLTVAEWARLLNMDIRTLDRRLHRGWSTERALSTKVDIRYSHPSFKRSIYR